MESEGGEREETPNEPSEKKKPHGQRWKRKRLGGQKSQGEPDPER